MKKNVVMAVVLSVLFMGYGFAGVAQASRGGDEPSFMSMRGAQNELKGLSLNDHFFPGLVQINFWGFPPRSCLLETGTLYDHLDWLTGFRDQLQTLLDRLDTLIALLENDDSPVDPGGDTPNAVPVPGAALLLGSAMVALAGLRRRVQR